MELSLVSFSLLVGSENLFSHGEIITYYYNEIFYGNSFSNING